MDHTFLQLQKRLAKQLWIVKEQTNKERTLVYIAGMSLDQEELAKVAGIAFYEERLLYVIGLLRNPETTVVFVTSTQIDPVILEYYFQLFGRNKQEQASMRKRWHHFYIGNSRTHKTLTRKVLSSKRVTNQVLSKIVSKEHAVLRCFNVSEDEQALAVKLGIPLFAPNPDLLHWGSKSGSRKIFKQAKLKPAYGIEDIHSMEELIAAIRKIKKQRNPEQVVIKFNYSFSGVGNANLLLKKFPKSNKAAEQYLKKNIVPCEPGMTKVQYLKKCFEMGGIVEEWLVGDKVYSPSVQVLIEPNQEVRILSTHEQLLDPETKQVYLGARFPARKKLRPYIVDQAKAVGNALAKEGVIGPLGIDFLVVKKRGKTYTHPVEINLRKGGTTHPFQIAQMLTEGTTRPIGAMLGKNKKKVYYYSFDNIKSSQYTGLTPKQLIAIVRESGLEFDSEGNMGVALHLMGALRKYGKFGAVCIARSPKAAEQLFVLLKKVVDAKVEELDIAIEAEELENTVNRKRLVDTFVTLARIPSPSGEEDQLRIWLREELVRLGCTVRVDKAGNIIAKKAGVGKVPILLSSHMDTVQPCHNVKPVVRGDVIMTDGTTILGADNKAGIVYIIEALRILRENKFSHIPLEIVLSTYEEQFSQGVKALDMSKIKSPFGLVIDGADVGEVDYTAPYIAVIDVTITGKAAHSGVEPENGISAIQIAAQAINRMKLGRIYPDTTANIGLITGGTNRNAIPGEVRLIGEVRSLSKRKLEEQLERMHKALEDAAEKYGGLLAIDSRVAVSGYTFSKTDKDIKHIMAVMKRVGIQPQLRQAGGGSDANVFVMRGVKTIDVGTGVRKPHTVEEHININDMVQMAEFVLEMIKV